jgi:hypothetical protein
MLDDSAYSTSHGVVGMLSMVVGVQMAVNLESDGKKTMTRNCRTKTRKGWMMAVFWVVAQYSLVVSSP